MRRTHLIVGLLGVIAFVITGQVMGRHAPNIRESGPGALPANSDFGVAADAAAGRFPADTPLRRIAADGFYFGATARLRRTQLANLFWADRAICWRDDARADRLRAEAELTALTIVSKIEKLQICRGSSLVERRPEKAGVASSILAPGTSFVFSSPHFSTPPR